MEPFSPSVHDDPRHLSLSLSLPLWFSLLVRPVPVAVYKSGRRLYPPTTLHRMEQRGGGYRGGPEEGGGVRGHTIRVPTASGVTRCCNLRRIVAEIRDWNRGRVMNRTDVFPALFQFPFAVSVFFFFFFFFLLQPTTFSRFSSRFDGEIDGSSGYCEFNFAPFFVFLDIFVLLLVKFFEL